MFSSYPITSIDDVSNNSYTYIVVGGGTAGCVLASRLSEDPAVTVLLIERGPIADGWAAKVPLLSSNFSDQRAPIYKWESAPLASVNGKTFTMVTGKALGGSTKINGLLYTRSVPGEYDAWEAAGRKGWGWKHVEPYFCKSEAYAGRSGAQNHRGAEGPWQTRSIEGIHFQSVASTIAVAPHLGVPHTLEDKGPTHPAASYAILDATIDGEGRRNATSDAFLPKELVRARKNLFICTGALVPALKIKDLKAVGVYLESDNVTDKPQRFCSFAEREVILCAGAISTPHILLLSGVGPAQHLSKHGIPVLKDLPGVGAHLQDHISVPVIYKVPITDSIEVLLAKPLVAIGGLLKYIFTGKGIFGTQVQQANIMAHSSLLPLPSTTPTSTPDSHGPADVPDIEIMIIPVNPTDRKFDVPKSHGTFSYLCTALRPKSAGSVRLASTNPQEQPLCDLGTLSHGDDRVPVRQSLRLALALGRAVRESGYPIDDLLVPPSESDADLDAFTDANLTTTYHYASSCRMDEEGYMGVVDDDLKVYGIAGLRIADASIFPAIPACHLQAPVVMVAERCADLIKSSYIGSASS